MLCTFLSSILTVICARSWRIQCHTLMTMDVWYILGPKGSEISSLLDDVDAIKCIEGDNIATFKEKVGAKNKAELEGVDVRKLEIFEFSKPETKCLAQATLSECMLGGSGTSQQPFIIYYRPRQGKTYFIRFLCMFFAAFGELCVCFDLNRAYAHGHS